MTETPMVTFAQFTDPAGNVVGLIPRPADPSTATGPSQGDGVPVDWFEILGPDPKAMWSFYRDLFGWEIEEGGTEEFLYGEVHGEGIGGGIGSRIGSVGASVAAAVLGAPLPLSLPASLNSNVRSARIVARALVVQD